MFYSNLIFLCSIFKTLYIFLFLMRLFVLVVLQKGVFLVEFVLLFAVGLLILFFLLDLLLLGLADAILLCRLLLGLIVLLA